MSIQSKGIPILTIASIAAVVLGYAGDGLIGISALAPLTVGAAVVCVGLGFYFNTGLRIIGIALSLVLSIFSGVSGIPMFAIFWSVMSLVIGTVQIQPERSDSL